MGKISNAIHLCVLRNSAGIKYALFYSFIKSRPAYFFSLIKLWVSSFLKINHTLIH